MPINRHRLAKLTATFDEHKFSYDGVEAWSARDLQCLLGYDTWHNFRNAIERAMASCANAGRDPSRHFIPFEGELDLSPDRIFNGAVKNSGRGRPREDMILSLFGAYLVAMNGDPSKEQVAFAHAYFALQTRKMELLEKHIAEVERLEAHRHLTRSEKELSGVLYQHGVDELGFRIIRSRGDQAFFGGLTSQEMNARLGGANDRPLANYLQTVLIKAKDLAVEITAYNTRTRDFRGVQRISDDHAGNNTNVRDALVESGIKPENLLPTEDTKKVEAWHKQGVVWVGVAAGELPALRNPAASNPALSASKCLDKVKARVA